MFVPNNDNNTYKYLVLKNGLRILLIDQKQNQTAYLSMHITVGHIHEPTKIEGLAHLLEHVLLMGTERYPNPNHFNEIINMGNGYVNAYTDDTATNYHYAIDDNLLVGSIKHFSSLFHEPLFDRSSIENEIKIIDSEHAKNINNEAWRIDRLLRLTSKKPYGKFSTGNLQTLDIKDIREHLLRFFNRYYIPEKMVLVVKCNVTGEIISTIEEEFGKINNLTKYDPVDRILEKKKINDLDSDSRINDNRALFDLKKIHCDQVIFDGDKKFFNSMIITKPIEKKSSIHLFWQMPSHFVFFKYKSIPYLLNLFNNKMNKSLFNELKNINLIRDIHAYIHDTICDTTLIHLDIELTESGINNVNIILDAVFQYINIIKNKGFNEQLYADYIKISKIKFCYFTTFNTLTDIVSIAENIANYPTDDFLFASNYYTPDIEKSKRIFDCSLQLLEPRNTVLIISTYKFIDLVKDFDAVYNIKYSFMVPFDYEKSGMIFNFDLPKSNPYVPENIIIKKNHEYNAPQKFNINDVTLYYFQEKEYPSPEIILNIRINYSYIENIYDYVCGELFILCIFDILYTKLYQVNEIGCIFNLMFDEYHISIDIIGINEIVIEVVNEIVNEILSPSFDNNIYERIKDTYFEFLSNMKYDSLMRQFKRILDRHVSKIYFPHTEKLKALSNIKFNDTKRFYETIKVVRIKCYVHGNIDDEDVKKIHKMTTKLTLNKRVFDDKDRDLVKKYDVPITTKTENESETNSISGIFFDLGYLKEDLIYKSSMLLILKTMMKEPFYEFSRERYQLGYIAKTIKIINGHDENQSVGIVLLIQSNRYDTEYLSKKIKEFGIEFVDKLRDLDEETFKKMIMSISNKLTSKFQTIYERHKYFWTIINTNVNNFEMRFRISDRILRTQKDEFNDFYIKNVLDKGLVININGY